LGFVKWLLTIKESKGKCRDLICNPKVNQNQLCLSYGLNEKDKKSKIKEKPKSS